MSRHHTHHQQRRPVLNGAGVFALALVLTCWIGGIVLVLGSMSHKKGDRARLQPPSEVAVIDSSTPAVAVQPVAPPLTPGPAVAEMPVQPPTGAPGAVPDELLPVAAPVIEKEPVAASAVPAAATLDEIVQVPRDSAGSGHRGNLAAAQLVEKGRKRAKRSNAGIKMPISNIVLTCEPTEFCTQFIYEDGGRLRSKFASGWHRR